MTNLWWFLAGMASVLLPLVFFVLLLVVDAKRRKSVCMKSYQTGSSKDKFLVWRNGKIHAILPQL